MNPKDQNRKSAPPAAGDEDIIDLTEILGDENSETVIEISAKMDDLDSLDLKTLLAEEAQAAPEPAPPAGGERVTNESLEDLLSSLNMGPSEPAAASEPEPLPEPEPVPPPEPRLRPVPPPETAVPLAAAVSLDEVRQQVQAVVSEDQLREIVQEVVQETVAHLCRELFPAIASDAIAREIEAIKQQMEEESN